MSMRGARNSVDGKRSIDPVVPMRAGPGHVAPGHVAPGPRIHGEGAAPLRETKAEREEPGERERIVLEALDPHLPNVLAGIIMGYHGVAVDAFNAAADEYASEYRRDPEVAARCEAAKVRAKAWVDLPSKKALTELFESAHSLEIDSLVGPVVAQVPWKPEWAQGLSSSEMWTLARANPQVLDDAYCHRNGVELMKVAFAWKNVPVQARLFKCFEADRKGLIAVLRMSANYWTSSIEAIDFVLARVDKKERRELFASANTASLQPAELSHLCARILSAGFAPHEAVELARGLIDWRCFSKKSVMSQSAEARTLEARKAFRALTLILHSASPADAVKLGRQFLGKRELSRLVDILTMPDAVGVTREELDHAIDVVTLVKKAPWMQAGALKKARDRVAPGSGD